jgi:lipid II:glycine glycyltransferase (peptidoglycan interpeptide bridge formation enzyme)
MNITIQNSLHEESWRQFVNGHPDGNIFHTPEMFKVFERTQGYTPTLWAAVDQQERALALLTPAQITLNQKIRHLTSRAVAYGSLLCDTSSEGQEALALLLQTYKREIGSELLFTELRNLSNLEAVQPILERNGFIYEDHLNYLIDINRSPEEILQSIKSRTRNYIRRGIRRGEISIEEVKDRDQLDACYNLLKRTYEAVHVPLANSSLFEATFDVLYPKSMARFVLAKKGQIPVAAAFLLLHKGTIYYWYGGLDRAYGSLHPNELLIWHILQWGAENGYSRFDFGGAGKPDEKYPVRDFKAKFEGELVSYGRNLFVHAPFRMAISQTAYQLVRRFFY